MAQWSSRALEVSRKTERIEIFLYLGHKQLENSYLLAYNMAKF